MDDVEIQRLSRAQRDRGTVPERLLGLLCDGAFDVERELLAREPRVLDLERRRRVRGQPEQPEPAVGVGRRGRRPEARHPLRVIGLDLSRARDVQPGDADDDPRGRLALDVDQPALDGLLGRQNDRRLLVRGVDRELDHPQAPPGRGGDQPQVLQALEPGSPGTRA